MHGILPAYDTSKTQGGPEKFRRVKARSVRTAVADATQGKNGYHCCEKAFVVSFPRRRESMSLRVKLSARVPGFRLGGRNDISSFVVPRCNRGMIDSESAAKNLYRYAYLYKSGACYEALTCGAHLSHTHPKLRKSCHRRHSRIRLVSVRRRNCRAKATSGRHCGGHRTSPSIAISRGLADGCHPPRTG